MTYDIGFNKATSSFIDASNGKWSAQNSGYVAHGNDIKNAESLFQVLSNNSSVKTFYITEKDVADIALLLPQTVPVIKGTLMIHEMHTCRKGELSCRKVA